jgi:fatty-acid desaturase
MPKFKLETLAGFLLCHSMALLALSPWFFSWTGVFLLLLGMLLTGVMGLNVGFHRLLTHRSFTCPLWLEHTLAVLGTCALQLSPAYWVAIHRRHHHYPDQENDPHSPIKGFLWAHLGWVLVRGGDMKAKTVIDRYARDLMRDPLYVALERNYNWIWLPFAVWLGLFVLGYSTITVGGGSSDDALQFGSSLVVWGGALRTVVVWHNTWAVNSVGHMWGYRNYQTPDDSRNSLTIGILAGGEGWHNNHHADPNSAKHGHRAGEFDFAWQVIRLLMWLGLASNVLLPSPDLASKFRAPAKTSEHGVKFDAE